MIATVALVADNFDARRIPLSSRERAKRPGPYPYYGAASVMDHLDDFLFDGEYLLVAEDGSVETPEGRPVLQLVKGKFWPNNHAHVLRAKEMDDTRFLFYAFQTVPVRPYLTGSVQYKLTQANLNRIEVPWPPKRERSAIASILGALDDKIDLNRRMNTTLEDIARALFKSWFVDFHPVRAKMRGEKPWGMDAATAKLFPDRLVESEIGEVPEGWGALPVGDVVDVKGGSTPSTENASYWEGGIHCWATPKDMSKLQSPVLLETERKVTDDGLRTISSGLLPAGTVLLSSRAPIGYLAIAQVPVAINQGFIALVCSGAVSNYYVLNWTRANMDAIEGRASGTTFQEISKGNFRPLPMLVPPSRVMAGFDGLAMPLYARIVANERETRTLRALRDTLLPRLLSGEVRVPVQQEGPIRV